MTLSAFRQMVRAEFGADLHRMTPANVREFLDRIQLSAAPGDGPRKFVIEEKELTYEGILRDFLAQILEMPPDQAVIRLWLYALEVSSASVVELEGDRLERLFARLGIPGGEEAI